MEFLDADVVVLPADRLQNLPTSGLVSPISPSFQPLSRAGAVFDPTGRPLGTFFRLFTKAG